MLLNGVTFDGAPFQVSILSLKAVGCGATAKIFAGHIVDPQPNQPARVAVKVFGNMLEDHHQELLIRELRAARQVSLGGHPSILPFLGSADFGLQTAIVAPYMANGNLLEYFQAHHGDDGVDKGKLICQVAEAVSRLHTVEGLVHGDLKCANGLVSDAGDALLADFGLSTFVEKARASATTAMNVRQMYTARFAAPEILRDVAGHPARLRSKTRESDVYAFGMLVLEAITERPPWDGAEEFAVMHWVCSGMKPHPPMDCMSLAWINVCWSCWAFSPASRPTMDTVLCKLSEHAYKPGSGSDEGLYFPVYRGASDALPAAPDLRVARSASPQIDFRGNSLGSSVREPSHDSDTVSWTTWAEPPTIPWTLTDCHADTQSRDLYTPRHNEKADPAAATKGVSLKHLGLHTRPDALHELVPWEKRFYGL